MRRTNQLAKYRDKIPVGLFLILDMQKSWISSLYISFN